ESLESVVAVAGKRRSVAMRPLRLSLQRLASDEVVIEPDEWPVAEGVRGEIVILDVGGLEAAADRCRALVSARRQPLAVLLHPLAREHRWQRRGNPAGLERVARVGARADLHQTEVASRLEDSFTALICLRARTPD